MYEREIEKVLVIVFFAICTLIMARGSMSNIKMNKDEFYVLRSNLFVRLLGWGCTIAGFIGMLLVIFYLKIDFRDMEEGIYAYLFTGGFFLIGIILLILVNRRIHFSRDKIISINSFGMKKEIYWDEVEEVQYHKNSRALRVISESKKIDIDIEYYGFYTFLDMLKGRLPYEDIYFLVDSIKER